MEKLKKYPKYKPSGVEWIGEIPEEWRLERTKWVYSESKERNRELHYQDDDLLSVSEYYGVAKRSDKIDNNDILNRAESLSENKVVKKGELVINIMLAWKKGLGSSNFEGIVSPSYCVYKLNNETNEPKYFHYLYRTDVYAESFRRFSRGIIESRLRLYSEEFFNILTLLPSPEEQTAIAYYLDEKTAKIDSLIEKKKKLIELYKEERTAIINQAVTRGINPNVKLKPSGIDWLGDIPEHWEVKKLKYVLSEKLKYGANEVAEFEDINFPRYIRITDFGEDGNLREDTFRSLPPEIAEKYLLKNGDILFARSGATVGKTFQFKNYEGVACFAGYLIKASPDCLQITSDFLYQFSKSGIYENWKNSIFNQATIQNIGADKYSLLLIPIPPIEVQNQLNQYIATETKRIDSTISKIEKEIELLVEYHIALISEVVTGKIKVI